MATRPDPAPRLARNGTRPLDPAIVAFVEALARANAARDVAALRPESDQHPHPAPAI